MSEGADGMSEGADEGSLLGKSDGLSEDFDDGCLDGMSERGI
jgi:hypothetical protein